MSIEEKKLETAISNFKLRHNYSLDELNEAYEKSKKIIDDMNAQKKDSQFRYVSKDLDELYLLLYKNLMIQIIKKVILKDVEFENVDGEYKNRVSNIERKCIEFYHSSTSYKTQVSTLFDLIRYELNIFESVNISRAKTIKEVNENINEFEKRINEIYKKFAKNIIDDVKKELTYESDYFEVDISKVASVVSLIKETYSVVCKMFNENKEIEEFIRNKKDINLSNREKIDDFMNRANSYLKALDSKEQKTPEDLQRKNLINHKAIEYYHKLLKEKDSESFMDTYNEAMLYLSQIMGVDIIEIPEEQEPPKPPTPGGR